MTEHQQEVVSVDGSISVDAKLAPLIKYLNRDGVLTEYSCEGGEDQYGGLYGYIMFRSLEGAQTALEDLASCAKKAGDKDLAASLAATPLIHLERRVACTPSTISSLDAEMDALVARGLYASVDVVHSPSWVPAANVTTTSLIRFNTQWRDAMLSVTPPAPLFAPPTRVPRDISNLPLETLLFDDYSDLTNDEAILLRLVAATSKEYEEVLTAVLGGKDEEEAARLVLASLNESIDLDPDEFYWAIARLAAVLAALPSAKSSSLVRRICPDINERSLGMGWGSQNDLISTLAYNSVPLAVASLIVEGTPPASYKQALESWEGFAASMGQEQLRQTCVAANGTVLRGFELVSAVAAAFQAEGFEAVFPGPALAGKARPRRASWTKRLSRLGKTVK